MFQLWGTIVIFELRQTTVNELNQFPHIYVTSNEHWEPSNIEIIPDYTEEVEYVHNTDSTNLRMRCIPSVIASVNIEPANPVLIYGSTESDIWFLIFPQLSLMRLCYPHNEGCSMWSGLKPARAYREYPNYARVPKCVRAYFWRSGREPIIWMKGRVNTRTLRLRSKFTTTTHVNVRDTIS